MHRHSDIGSNARLTVLWQLRVHRGGLTPRQLLRATALHPHTLEQAMAGLHRDAQVEARRHGGVQVWRIPFNRLEPLR